MCYKGAQGSSPPCHSGASGPGGPRPCPNFTGQEAKAQRQSLFGEEAASEERAAQSQVCHPKALVLPAPYSPKDL